MHANSLEACTPAGRRDQKGLQRVSNTLIQSFTARRCPVVHLADLAKNVVLVARSIIGCTVRPSIIVHRVTNNTRMMFRIWLILISWRMICELFYSIFYCYKILCNDKIDWLLASSTNENRWLFTQKYFRWSTSSSVLKIYRLKLNYNDKGAYVTLLLYLLQAFEVRYKYNPVCFVSKLTMNSKSGSLKWLKYNLYI